MKTFEVTTTINAAPEKIWALLTDGPNYPSWNPTVTQIEGTIAAGERIKVHAKISPNRAFPVTVSAFEGPRCMKWSDGMPLGLFKAERTFTLTPGEDGQTEFFMREVFSGLLSPLIGMTIPDLTEAFQEFADGLKAAAEAE